MKNLIKIFAILISLNFSALGSFAKADSLLKVFVFLSEKCPVCQSSTLELNRLAEKFESSQVRFVGVFPNTDISNEQSVKDFKNKYKLNFDMEIDENQIITNKLKATVTPQVFVIEEISGKIIYSGKIDNSFERVGKRRKVVTEYYLDSALENYLNQKLINPVLTNPVGCYISF